MDGTQWVLVLERGTVSVAATLKAESLKLYPNPAKAGGSITVALPAGVTTANAEVVDAGGRIISQQAVMGSQAVLSCSSRCRCVHREAAYRKRYCGG